MSCPHYRLSWLDVGPKAYTWPVLVSLVACVAAHVWLLRAAAKNKALVERLQTLAGAGAFGKISEERPPGIFAEALAGLTVSTIPLAVWASSWFAAALKTRPGGFVDEHFWKQISMLEARVGALNACAVFGPPVCLLAAFAWATAFSWRLRIRGLQRAAELALDVAAPRLAAPYRASLQRQRDIAAWLLHPGPRARWLQAACSCFVLTTAFPMGAGVHLGLADLAEACNWKGDPELIDAEMVRGRRALSFASFTAFAGVVAGGAFLLAVLAAPRRARRRLAPGLGPAPRARYSLLVEAACVSGAALLTIATGPYASENADPLPLGFGTPTRRAPFASFIGSDGLEGPDAVVDGPQVDLSAKMINGSRWTTLEDLTRYLSATRELWRQVQPNRPFPGVLAAGCGAATSSRDIVEFAGVARAAGYRGVSMVLVRPKPRSRALLGDFVLYHRSAVNIEVSPEANGVDVDVVRASEHGSCAELVRAAAEARRRGRRVRLEP